MPTFALHPSGEEVKYEPFDAIIGEQSITLALHAGRAGEWLLSHIESGGLVTRWRSRTRKAAAEEAQPAIDALVAKHGADRVLRVLAEAERLAKRPEGIGRAGAVLARDRAEHP
jgi:hypothetical protein